MVLKNRYTPKQCNICGHVYTKNWLRHTMVMTGNHDLRGHVVRPLEEEESPIHPFYGTYRKEAGTFDINFDDKDRHMKLHDKRNVPALRKELRRHLLRGYYIPYRY